MAGLLQTNDDRLDFVGLVPLGGFARPGRSGETLEASSVVLDVRDVHAVFCVYRKAALVPSTDREVIVKVERAEVEQRVVVRA